MSDLLRRFDNDMVCRFKNRNAPFPYLFEYNNVSPQGRFYKGIKILIQNNLLERISRERTILNLKRLFGLTVEKSEQYYEQFAGEM